MFFGSFQHSIDDKGRLTLPAKWRSELAGGVVVTRGLDGCLFIFPKDKFEAMALETDAQGIALADARAWSRYLLGHAADVEPDKQGRVLIPQDLRSFAGINGEVVVMGVMSRLEVWNPQRYKEANEHLEADANAVAERMGHTMQQASSRSAP